MAISTYDEQFLNDEQKRQLQAFTDAWNRANAAGDQAGMEAAHAAAERVRAQAGYSGAGEGGGYVDLGTKQSESKTYTPTPKPEPYTPAQPPSYQPQVDAVNQLYDAQREATLAALKSAFEANSSTLEAQRAEIPGVYQAQRNSVAAESERAGHNFNEYAAAAGLNSGAGGQAALARSNQLQGDLSALGQQEAAEQRKLESEIAQLKIQYQNEIAAAIAQGEYERAAALLEEYKRAAESKVTTAQAQADENYRGYQSGLAGTQFAADENYRAWQSGVSSRESDVENDFSEWQRRLQMAELQAQYGDLSGLKALGVDTSKYEAGLAGAGGASGSQDNSKALKDAADIFGNVLKGVASTFSGKKTENSQGKPSTSAPGLGVTAQGILGSLRSHPTSVSSFAAAVEEALQKGYITENEASYLLEQIGY